MKFIITITVLAVCALSDCNKGDSLSGNTSNQERLGEKPIKRDQEGLIPQPQNTQRVPSVEYHAGKVLNWDYLKDIDYSALNEVETTDYFSFPNDKVMVTLQLGNKKYYRLNVAADGDCQIRVMNLKVLQRSRPSVEHIINSIKNLKNIRIL